MSTSDFNQTQIQIIDYAFRLLGIKGNYKEIQAEDYSFASTTLNMMLKAWSAQGLHLWEKDEAVLFPNPNQNKYLISENNTADMCARQKDITTTQALVDIPSGTTSVMLASVANLAIADNIGIMLSDNTIQWTTVTSIVGNIVNIPTPLINSVNAGAYIYHFTNRIFKPLRIIDKSCRRVINNANDITAIAPYATSKNLPNASLTTFTCVDPTGGLLNTTDYTCVIQLSNNTLHYSNITSITPSGPVVLTIVLTTPMAVTSNLNASVWFINKTLNPINTYNPFLQKQEVWMKELAYSDYMALSNKTSKGVTSTFMYLPKVTTGEFYLWLTPIDASQQIYFSYERIIQDLDNYADDFDLPSEWLEAISWQLALRLAPAYGKEDRGISYITPIASQMLDNLKQWDNENVEIKIKIGKYS